MKSLIPVLKINFPRRQPEGVSFIRRRRSNNGKLIFRTGIKSSSLGFTLVEVLIAIAILAVLAVIIRSSWSGNLIRFKTAQIKVDAVELLQMKILEIQAEYNNKVITLPEELQSGTFEDERYRKYKWEWKSQDIQIPDISSLITTDGQDPLVVSVLENFVKYLNESIKEVEVTVTYQSGKERPYKFVVPFYMVNFDNELSMGINMPEGMGGGMPGAGGTSGTGSTGTGSEQQPQGTGTGGPSR